MDEAVIEQSVINISRRMDARHNDYLIVVNPKTFASTAYAESFIQYEGKFTVYMIHTF
jgi:hypothetical protein